MRYSSSSLKLLVHLGKFTKSKGVVGPFREIIHVQTGITQVFRYGCLPPRLILLKRYGLCGSLVYEDDKNHLRLCTFRGFLLQDYFPKKWHHASGDETYWEMYENLINYRS